MAEKMRSMRLSDERWAWLAEEGVRRGTSRTGVVEALIDGAMVGGLWLSVESVAAPAGSRVTVVPGQVSSSRPGIRVDTVEDAHAWALQRQARLNAAKDRAS